MLWIFAKLATTVEQAKSAVASIGGELVGASNGIFRIRVTANTVEGLREQALYLENRYSDLFHSVHLYLLSRSASLDYGDHSADIDSTIAIPAQEVGASNSFPTNEGVHWWGNHEWVLALLAFLTFGSIIVIAYRRLKSG
jgi:hypothetical protein